MVHHITMWKLKDFAENKTKQENAKLMKEGLEGLKKKIPNVVELRVGINVENKYSDFDIVLHSYFHTMEDYFIYQRHPEHERVGSWIYKIRQHRHCVDYEFEPV